MMLQDFYLIGKFKGSEEDYMKFDVELHSLLNQYNLLWKQTYFEDEKYTEDDFI